MDFPICAHWYTSWPNSAKILEIVLDRAQLYFALSSHYLKDQPKAINKRPFLALARFVHARPIKWLTLSPPPAESPTIAIFCGSYPSSKHHL